MSTEYTKTTWQTGDIITADKMNNIENGIKGIEGDIATLSEMGSEIDELGEELTDIKDGLNDVTQVGKNLYDPSKQINNYYTNIANGNLVSDSRFAVTDFIPVPPSTTVKTIGSVNDVWSQTNSVRYCAVYNSSKEFASCNTDMATNFTYTNGAESMQYVRYTIFIAHPSFTVTNLLVYYYAGTIPTEEDYQPFRYVVRTDAINANEIADGIMNGDNEIENAVRSLSGTIIPSYWSGEVENTITSVNDYIWTNSNSATNSTVIAFVSDMHIEKAAKVHGALIGELDKVLHFDFVVNGGDNVTSADTNYEHELAMQESMNLLNPVREKLYTVMGNHDATNVQSSYIYTAAHKNILITEVMKNTCHFEGAYVDNSSRWLSYYRDDEFAKIRYIFLDNCYAYPNRFTQQDITWLNGVLESTPTGYHVAVFMHNPGYFESIPGTTALNNFRLNAQTLFYKMLTAFDGKTSISYTEDGVTINADYSTTGRTVIGVFAGHVHTDLIFQVEGINVCTTKNAFADTGSTGTTDETAFDCIVINKTQKEVKLFRCGKGSDRSFSY